MTLLSFFLLFSPSLCLPVSHLLPSLLPLLPLSISLFQEFILVFFSFLNILLSMYLHSVYSIESPHRLIGFVYFITQVFHIPLYLTMDNLLISIFALCILQLYCHSDGPIVMTLSFAQLYFLMIPFESLVIFLVSKYILLETTITDPGFFQLISV